MAMLENCVREQAKGKGLGCRKNRDTGLKTEGVLRFFCYLIVVLLN